MMNFLKKLFGGGGSSNELVIYVRPKMCKIIETLRLDLKSELSLTDDGSGYWVRKVANNPRCPFEVEIILHFDKSRRLINREITNGEFVTAEEAGVEG